MAFERIFNYITLLVILIALATDISAIKCWRCTSSSKFCGDNLNQTNLTENQLDWYYVECSPPRKKISYNGNKIISKCNVRIDLAYEKLVYTRKCVWEEENVSPNSCARTDEENYDDPNVEVLACETCIEDGCNVIINNYFKMELEQPTVSNFGLMTLFFEPKTLFLNLLLITIYHCRRIKMN